MIACAGLTVANSATAGVAGTTGATETVTCNDGYATAGGDPTYTATCSASTTAGTSEWTGIEACVGMLRVMFFMFICCDIGPCVCYVTLVCFMCSRGMSRSHGDQQ